jgi:ABC-type transport system substrate-binding protein
MSVRTESELKALFQTGDTPTQQNFSDWIETMESQDAATQAAAQAASDAVATLNAAYAGLTFNYFVVASYDGTAWTIIGVPKNVASVTKISSSIVKITFTNPIANTNYPFAVSYGMPPQAGSLGVTKNVAYVQITNKGEAGTATDIRSDTYMFFG